LRSRTPGTELLDAPGIHFVRAVGGKPAATIVRGVMRLADGPGSSPSWLLDATGRRVTELQPGANDVSRLAPGVYFVWEQVAVGGERSTVGVRKIVIGR
jgi:hypothetical protein